jgi:adenylate cyclase
VRQTFLFAHMAGYTAVTAVHWHEPVADVVDDFRRLVYELLTDFRAHEVMGIGDALMLRAPEADHAVCLGMAIADLVASTDGFPAARVGMHTGPALQRGGHWFGQTVNVAARVSQLASDDEVLLTEATRSAAGRLDGVEYERRGRSMLKNLAESPQLYAAVAAERVAGGELTIDPVCRLAVRPARAAGSLNYDGAVYWFCSLDCARRFASDPARYARRLDARPM